MKLCSEKLKYYENLRMLLHHILLLQIYNRRNCPLKFCNLSFHHPLKKKEVFISVLISLTCSPDPTTNFKLRVLNEEWEPFEKGVTEICANQRFNQWVFFNDFFEFIALGYKKQYRTIHKVRKHFLRDFWHPNSPCQQQSAFQ